MVDRARYRRGAHTVADLKYHMVWKTKYGYPVLRGEVGLRLRLRLRAVPRMIAAEHDMIVVQGNIRPNHVHILVSAPTYLSPVQMLPYLKGKFSYRLQREFRELQKRYWGQHLWEGVFLCDGGGGDGRASQALWRRARGRIGYLPSLGRAPGADRRNELQADSSATRTDFSLKGRLRP